MKKLIEKWREGDDFLEQDTHESAILYCADELQAYLDSLWTDITDDQATWPQFGQLIMYTTKENEQPYVCHFKSRGKYMTAWRPLISIDSPTGVCDE